MNSSTVADTVSVLTNPKGFHMRPCGAFAEAAARFQSKVTVSRRGATSTARASWT